MNTRRQQLEKNELAERLGPGVNAVQPLLPYILGAIAIVVVGSIGWGLYSSSARKQEAVAWTEYYFAISEQDGDSFLDLADEFPSSTAASWARQTAGARYLDEGIEAIYRNKEEGVDLLKQAIEAFEGVLDSSPAEELRGKALLGLARANETLADVDNALSYYQDFLASSAATGRLQILANERIQFLRSDAGKEFYAWFAEQDPKPDAAIQLPSGMDSPPTMEGNPLNFDLTDSPEAGDSVPAPPVSPIDTEGLELPDVGVDSNDGNATSVDSIGLPDPDASPEGSSSAEGSGSEESSGAAGSDTETTDATNSGSDEQ